MSVEQPQVDAGAEIRVIFDEAKFAAVVDGLHVFDEIGVGFECVRVKEVLPLCTAYPVDGVWEGHFEERLSTGLLFFLCRISAMVEVEMCEYDIRNILTGNIPPSKFFLQIDQVEEVVIAELFQVFVTRPVVDEYDLPVPVAD